MKVFYRLTFVLKNNFSNIANFSLQINFGWCKGDDNFGGRQRKELDDFTKSLGKQMNLVMYRMQDTENVRFR